MSSGQFENDEVSMVDVLAEDNELEEEANAVFGDSDDQNCTYDKVQTCLLSFDLIRTHSCLL